MAVYESEWRFCRSDFYANKSAHKCRFIGVVEASCHDNDDYEDDDDDDRESTERCYRPRPQLLQYILLLQPLFASNPHRTHSGLKSCIDDTLRGIHRLHWSARWVVAYDVAVWVVVRLVRGF